MLFLLLIIFFDNNLSLHGLTGSILLTYFNAHPFLAMMTIGSFLGEMSFNTSVRIKQ